MAAAKGEGNVGAKLTAEQVRAIRRSRDKIVYLAEVYGISIVQVSRIRNRHQWKDLPDEDE